MPHRLVHRNLALLIVTGLAAGVGGCSGMGDIPNPFENTDRAFAKSFIEVPDWAKASRAKSAPLGPSGPVAPEELVDAAGHCAPEAPHAQPTAESPAPAAEQPASDAKTDQAPVAPAAPPVYGSVAGDLAGARMPQGPAPAPMPVAAKPSERMDRLQPEGGGSFAAPMASGGIALSMTECQVVRRAGQPSNVTIGAGEKGARKVVLTYLSGQWPGIYTFDSGRLKEIAATPQQEKPAKPIAKKKPKKAAPKTATTERVYVQ